MTSPKKKAFLTGGTGFVGSHLAEELICRGYKVTCLVRRELKWLEGMDVEVVYGDLASADRLCGQIAGSTHIFHVAGLTRARTEAQMNEANVTGTLNLLRAAIRCLPNLKRMLITSSLAAVGFSERLVATETSPLRPISAYGRSKARMENAVAALLKDRSSGSVPITIVRPPAVYGPRERDIFSFIKMVSYGIAPMAGSGTRPEISLVYVEDLVAGMIDAAEHPAAAGETYFIGSDEHYSWRDVKAATTAALGKRGALTVPVPKEMVATVGSVVEFGGRILGKYPPLNEEKAVEILKACKMCSIAKAADDFGYRQQTSLEEGLKSTVQWYRDRDWL